MRVEFTIPGPPRSWERAVAVGGERGRSLNTKSHRAAARHIQACGSAALLFLPGGASRWPRDARYDLTIGMFFGSMRTQDDDRVENMLKDGLKGVLWKDDAWFYFRRIVKTLALDRENPRVEMIVEVVP